MPRKDLLDTAFEVMQIGELLRRRQLSDAQLEELQRKRGLAEQERADRESLIGSLEQRTGPVTRATPPREPGVMPEGTEPRLADLLQMAGTPTRVSTTLEEVPDRPFEPIGLSKTAKIAGAFKPEAAKLILEQAERQGRFPVSAAQYGSGQFNTRLQSLLSALPENLARNLLTSFDVTEQGTQAKLAEPTSPEQRLTVEASRVGGGPEGAKKFLQETRLGDKDLLAAGNDLLQRAQSIRANLTGGTTSFGTILNPLSGIEAERARVQMNNMMRLAQQHFDDYAQRTGTPKIDLFSAPEQGRQSAIQAYVQQALAGMGIKDPRKATPEQIRQIEEEIRQIFGQSAELPRR